MREPIDRWRVCLHEAGHLCAARAQSYLDMPCRAAVFENGGGFSIGPRGLPDSHETIAICAGAYAGRLAQKMPVPKTRPIAVEIRARRPETPERARDKKAFDIVSENHPDGVQMMEWALKDHRNESADDLKLRVVSICDQAEELVEKNKEEIRRVAEILYHDGKIRFEGDPEHKLYFERTSENARKNCEDKLQTKK